MYVHLKPASPELVVGYTFHRLLVAQLGTMVTPSPKPTATHRMNLLRLVSGSIEITCVMHELISVKDAGDIFECLVHVAKESQIFVVNESDCDVWQQM